MIGDKKFGLIDGEDVIGFELIFLFGVGRLNVG